MSVFKRLMTGKNGSHKKSAVFGALGLVAMVVVLITLLGSSGSSGEVMAAEVEAREFVSIVVEKGELKAARTATFSAPRLRYGGGQLILALAPEGEVIEAGDLVVQFDEAALLNLVANQQSEVEEVESQLTRTIAEQESQMASLQASLENQQHSFAQAELRMRAMEFESEIAQIQEEFNYKKSELALERAQEQVNTQILRNQVTLQQRQQSLDRARRELSDLQAELGAALQYAEFPGLVIYEKTYGPEGEAKVSVGTTAFPGQAIISIPDLTTMTVEVGISELDVRRVAMGQKALIRVDAYPDAVYTGEITDISPLARRSGLSQMKIFDCIVTIDGTDLALRPGMTAQVSIITHYQREAVVVPLDAVFRQGDRTLVFTVGNKIEEVDVVLGAENGNYVVIVDGLSAGMRVALRDPFMPLEELETAGIDALLANREASGGAAGDIGSMVGMMMRGRGGGGGDMMRIFR
ncbi:efflux RND transporter periplasmic adaptor subunit [Candidatus Zixiibacteriota bacterium]